MGSSKLSFAIGVEVGTGGLGTVLAGGAALSSAGNLTAGMIQVMGAFMPQSCEMNLAADVAGSALSFSGMYTYMTGGTVETAVRRAGWEGMALGAFQNGALGENIKVPDVYDMITGAKDGLKKNEGAKPKCGCS